MAAGAMAHRRPRSQREEDEEVLATVQVRWRWLGAW